MKHRPPKRRPEHDERPQKVYNAQDEQLDGVFVRPVSSSTPSTPSTSASSTGDLANPATLRALLRRHGVQPKKGLGQHLLVDRAALDATVAAAELTPDDAVMEVGAGPGVLTVELAARAGRVVAVEVDDAILPVLRETTARFPNVEIINADLLKVDPAQVFGETPYKLVANLPYYITAPTLRHFLEATRPPQRMVVMTQSEVAERMVAQPGDMSLLSVSVQFYGRATLVMRVPASAFFPPPQVDSAIVRVDVAPEPPLIGPARDQLFRLAHAGFAEKRKQLHNSLARNLHESAETISRWLAAANIEPSRRAQTLSLGDWLRLTAVTMIEGTGDGRGDDGRGG